MDPERQLGLVQHPNTTLASQFSMSCSLPIRWAVDTSRWQPDKLEWHSMLESLPAEVRAEVRRYKQTADQKRALLSRLLQRTAVRSVFLVPLSEVDIRRTKGGKPFWMNSVKKSSAPNFNYNVSHEGDFVVLAAESLCVCGIDVAAPMQSRSTTLRTLADIQKAFGRQLTSNEWNCVESAGDLTAQMVMFQKFWSLKEAFVKARGDGLGFDLGNAEFHLGPKQAGLQAATVSVAGQILTRWKFYVHALARGHIASVALGPPEDVVDAWGEFNSTFSQPCLDSAQIQACQAGPEPAFTLLEASELLQ